MDPTEWRTIYLLLSTSSDYRLKMNVPDLILLEPDGSICSWICTSKEGYIIQRSPDLCNINSVKEYFIDRYSKQVRIGGHPYVCLERLTSGYVGSFGRPSALISKDLFEPSLLKLDRFHQAVRHVEYCQQKSSGANPPKDSPYGTKNIYSLQAYIQPANDLRYITTYTDTGSEVLCESFAASYSKRFASGGQMDGQDTQENVPVPLMRQLRRWTGNILEFLYRVHGCKLQGLVCEYVFDLQGKIVLHSILSVVVLQQLPNILPKSAYSQSADEAVAINMSYDPSMKRGLERFSETRKSSLMAMDQTSQKTEYRRGSIANITPVNSSSPSRRASVIGALQTSKMRDRIGSISISPNARNRSGSIQMSPDRRQSVVDPRRSSRRDSIIGRPTTKPGRRQSVKPKVEVASGHRRRGDGLIVDFDDSSYGEEEDETTKPPEDEIISALKADGFVFTRDMKDYMIETLKKHRQVDAEEVSPFLEIDSKDDRDKLAVALADLESAPSSVKELISDILLKRFGTKESHANIKKHELLKHMEECVRSLTDVVVRMKTEMTSLKEKNEDIAFQLQGARTSNMDLNKQLVDAETELEELNESIGNSVQMLTNERDELKLELSRKDTIIEDMMKKIVAHDEISRTQYEDILKEERRLMSFTESSYLPLNIYDLLREERDRDGEVHYAIQKFLFAHDATFRRIFQHYAAEGSDAHNAFTMSLLQFWRFVKDCKIRNRDLSLARIDLIFVRSNVEPIDKNAPDKEEEHNPERHLVYHEFIECIIRMACIRFPHVIGMYNRIVTLVTTKILPNAKYKRAENMKKLLGDKKMQTIFQKWEKKMYRIFKLYCKIMPEDGPQGKPMMQIEEFISLIRDCNLMEDDLPYSSVVNAFVNCVLDDPTLRPPVSDAPPNMSFDEFKEGLSRCALIKFIDCEVPNTAKVNCFIQFVCTGKKNFPIRNPKSGRRGGHDSRSGIRTPSTAPEEDQDN
eukprot:TRINITY_DN3764_c0_g1_i5.p1 TRINITY_DN3764_c0_g1~~TRINITY_DN3764_c0_g1_i5.p1  ORF type:complete len:973 (+),score=162.60 TRINITY_DN3764_c0_g1_i5:114-3032(+)